MTPAKPWMRPRRLLQHVGAVAIGGSVVGSMMPYPNIRFEEPQAAQKAAQKPESPQSTSDPLAVANTKRHGRVPRVEQPKWEAPVTPPPSAACPADMVLVSGAYCTSVKHDCIRWLDDQALPFARCGEYAPEAECTGQRLQLRFCIDRFESADADGLPINHQSFALASQRCEGQNRRLCTESEWTFACEGPEMLPYPYGLRREPKCNQDRTDLFEQNPKRRVLKDLREPNDPSSQCVSPFGVYNLVGNLDEPTLRESPHQPRFSNALKGGWWMAGRNRCRPATTAHDNFYRDIQIGVRCCADADSEILTLRR